MVKNNFGMCCFFASEVVWSVLLDQPIMFDTLMLHIRLLEALLEAHDVRMILRNQLRLQLFPTTQWLQRSRSRMISISSFSFSGSWTSKKPLQPMGSTGLGTDSPRKNGCKNDKQQLDLTSLPRLREDSRLGQHMTAISP